MVFVDWFQTEHADMFSTVGERKITQTPDPQKFTTWCWMLKYNRIAEKSSTEAGVFLGQGYDWN